MATRVLDPYLGDLQAIIHIKQITIARLTICAHIEISGSI
jgi:hypothetical protein